MDTLAASFLLWTLVFLLQRRPAWAGLFAALALGTRYSTWGSVAFLPLAALVATKGSPKEKLRSVFLFCGIASMGALPFLIRNFLLNERHPFFPVDSAEVMAGWGVLNYGRGSDFLSFLLLPFDLLYTNSFVNGFFDYTLGKLFYLQLAAIFLGLAFCLAFKKRIRVVASHPSLDIGLWITIAFAFVHLLVWFRSSQQLRFLIPSLVILNLGMLLTIARYAGAKLLACITLAGVLSITSVQGDSIRIAMGSQQSPFVLKALAAKTCFMRAGVGNEAVGYLHRDGILGFFHHDFVFLQTHTYSVPGKNPPEVRWIFSLEPKAGFQPWPPQDPCLLKRAESSS
jgi:hypothetical protein